MGLDTIYRATTAAAPYDGLQQLPVRILLDNVRSMYNVGSSENSIVASRFQSIEVGDWAAART